MLMWRLLLAANHFFEEEAAAQSVMDMFILGNSSNFVPVEATLISPYIAGTLSLSLSPSSR